MILLVHLLLGALIGQKISDPVLAIVLAFLSHYFLDLFPHIEYPIENITKKQWHRALPDILRVILDFSVGILLIFLFANPLANSKNIIIFACALFAILPDGFSLLDSVAKNKILQKHSKFHQKRIHFLRDKKISIFWRVSSQIIAVITFIILLKF